MITTRKYISTHCSVIGLLIGLITFGASCKKNTSWIMHGDFYLVNNTDYPITYSMSGFEKFNISPRSTIVVKETQDGLEDVEPSYYRAPFLSQGIKDSFTVRFGNTRCWEAINSEHSPLDIRNYIPEKLGERTYKFTYTFTESDYNRAVKCP